MPGIFWTRLPLPLRLNHINSYLLKDGNGWYIVDCGIDTPETRETWNQLFRDVMGGGNILGVIVTHHHPDHIGLAGWLCDRFKAPLLASRACFLFSSAYYHAPNLLDGRSQIELLEKLGVPQEVIADFASQSVDYRKALAPPPASYVRLSSGQTMTIGGRVFEILQMEGHSPEQILLAAPADHILISADHIMERISPHVSSVDFEERADALGEYFDTLFSLQKALDDRTLVLAGHNRPFTGLHTRCRELVDHHKDRCDFVISASKEGGKTIGELFPLMFSANLGAREMNYAYLELMAHVNHLVHRGRVSWSYSNGEFPRLISSCH